MAHKFFKEGVYEPPKEYEKDVRQLRNWLNTQHHLPALSDEHLNLFLHSCESDLARTKTTIETYYTLRTHATDLFGNRDPLGSDVQDMLNICNLVPVSRTTPEGYKVLLYRLVNSDPSKFTFIPSLKLFFMYNDIRLAEDGLVPGYVVIFDMKGVSLSHLTKVSIMAIKKFMTYIQDCHPARLKAVHVINTVAFIDKVLALIKPFMKGSLVHMLHLHGPVESLEKFLPLDILPEEYGGKSESCISCHAKQRQLLEKDYVKWFQSEERLKVDESNRKGKKNTEAESYGADGSFRRLAID